MSRKIVDLSTKISQNYPVFYSAAGLWGLAHQVVADADTYEMTGTLRTFGRIKELFRTSFISMSGHANTHMK